MRLGLTSSPLGRDGDADAGADGDAEIDADVDLEADRDADLDLDRDVDPDTDGEADPDSDLDLDSDTGPVDLGPFTFVRTLGTSRCDGTTSVITVPDGVEVAAGHTVLVRVVQRPRGELPAIATDSQGNLYESNVTLVNETEDYPRLDVLTAYVVAPLAPGDAVTVTHNGVRANGVVVEELAGIAAADRVEDLVTASTDSRSVTAEIAAASTPVLLYAAEANINDPNATESPGWLTTSALDTSCGGSPGNAQTRGALLLGSSTDPVGYALTLTSPERWILALIAYRPE